MKRVIAFFVIVVLFIVFAYFKQDEFAFSDCNKLVVVTSEIYNEFNEQPIKNGDEYYYTLTGDEISFFKNNISHFKYKGLSLYYDNSYDLDFFKNIFKTQLTNPSKVENYQIYYGYYDNYRDYKIIDGKKINLQLVHTQNEWIAGFPLILTGY